jgi:hypothetical protein
MAALTVVLKAVHLAVLLEMKKVGQKVDLKVA